ncbi:hypothetical protein [Sorangium sp. So ce341]|uniref:hypothetical protein n=1 Tax=Sorangium sp. So ce341 TaxID=3133302 RepID=UPI003F60603B
MLVTASLAHAQSPAAGVAPRPAAPAPPAAAAAPAPAAPAPANAPAHAPANAPAPAPANAPAPAAAPETGAAAAAPAAAAAAPAGAGEASILARLEAAEKRSADLEKRLAAIEDAQGAPAQEEGRELLQLYGFIDVGVQRTWAPENSGLAAALPQANALNFVVGNLNLYLDAQPSDHFRFLGELRFTTAPGGAPVPVTTPLPPDVAYRVTTQEYGSFDSTSIALGSPTLYGGLVSIERAHIDWTRFNLFKVRVGQFFTPIGIYNVDHGSPVLITAAIPYFITSRLFPTRQTGVMIYGNAFAGPWELGYDAYVSNGRNENAPFAFDDNRGFGGRLHASYEDPGKLTLKLGASFIASHARDWVVDYKLNAPSPDIHSTWSFQEYTGAGDVSLDIGKTRVRAEAAVVRVVYDEGKRQGGFGSYAPDAWKTSTYAVAAHRLDFLNMEPFVIGAMLHAPFLGHDTMFQVGGGLNFYITPDVTLRTQVLRTIMTVLREQESTAPALPALPALEDFHTTAALARLILAF